MRPVDQTKANNSLLDARRQFDRQAENEYVEVSVSRDEGAAKDIILGDNPNGPALVTKNKVNKLGAEQKQ